MGARRIRARRKEPSEKQKPFFDKQATGESKFFGVNSVQRKLNVGKADDAAEKEAESAAAKVMQVQKAEQKEEDKPVQKAEQKEEEKPVQKAEQKEEEKPVQKAEEKEEEKPVQKAEKKEEEKPVQKSESKNESKIRRKDHGMEANKEQDSANSTFEKLLVKRKGMGFAMPNDLRKDMEGKFRTNFRDVRIHNDKEAFDMCESIHAQAFTHGNDIYFNEGMYNPDALSGRELLAHELTHVVQQNG